MGEYVDLVIGYNLAKDMVTLTKERHAKEEFALQREADAIGQKLVLVESGFSPLDYDQAMTFLCFEGDFREAMKFADGVAMVERAIKFLRAGGLYLRTSRVAVKRYDKWACQTSDAEYGHGPRHGSIWASIGFVRDQCGRAHGPLEEEQALSCIRLIRYLIDNPEAPMPANY